MSRTICWKGEDVSVSKDRQGQGNQYPMGDGGLANGNLESMRMNDIPRIIVARPRAVPIPLPLIALGPTRLNLIPHSCQLQAHYSLE